ncbi:MAG TPA: hypothetical protein VFB41_08130 [Solirubrobacteraceae bacterium]|nr:hypothetical protein [Solirubrobacteraceae bacterium]
MAVVGTAASAIQFVPHLADFAQQLTVFQRTPPMVSPRGNRPTDRDWYVQTPVWEEAPEHDPVSDTTSTLFTAMRKPRGELAEKLRGVDADTQRLMVNHDYQERLRASVDEMIDDRRPPSR